MHFEISICPSFYKDRSMPFDLLTFLTALKTVDCIDFAGFILEYLCGFATLRELFNKTHP